MIYRGPGQLLRGLLLPGIVLGRCRSPTCCGLTRSAVAETAQSTRVRTAAVATGASRSRVVSMHILRNSADPGRHVPGRDLALLGGAVVTEGIFNIHGVGGALYQAVTCQGGTPPSSAS